MKIVLAQEYGCVCFRINFDKYVYDINDINCEFPRIGISISEPICELIKKAVAMKLHLEGVEIEINRSIFDHDRISFLGSINGTFLKWELTYERIV